MTESKERRQARQLQQKRLNALADTLARHPDTSQQYRDACGIVRRPDPGSVELLAHPGALRPAIAFRRIPNHTLVIEHSDPYWCKDSYHLPDPRKDQPGPASLKLPTWRSKAVAWANAQTILDHWHENESLDGPPKDQELRGALQLFYERPASRRRQIPGPPDGPTPEEQLLHILMTRILEPHVYQLATELTRALRIHRLRYNRAAVNRQTEPRPRITCD